MVNATFTDEMKELLASMVGKRFVSYECSKDSFSRAFGNMRINFNGRSIELTNEEQTFPLFDGEEDMTCFACKVVDSKRPFEPDVVAETTVTDVNKSITSIEVVTDTIEVNNGEYSIVYDMALIFHMGESVLMVSRDTWFSELITIKENDDYNQAFSVDDQKESWSNDGEYKVNVKRVRKSI